MHRKLAKVCLDCIIRGTFGPDNYIKDILLGYKRKHSLLADKDVGKEDFTSVWLGRYYTFNASLKLGTNDYEFQLFFVLPYSHNYFIFIHDPNYFLFSFKESLPIIGKIVNPNSTFSHFYNLILTEVEELDVPGDPCNTDPDYNFNSCIREKSLKVFFFLL